MRKTSELIRIALQYHRGNGGSGAGLCDIMDSNSAAEEFTWDERSRLITEGKDMMYSMELITNCTCMYLYEYMPRTYMLSEQAAKQAALCWEAYADKLESEGN